MYVRGNILQLDNVATLADTSSVALYAVDRDPLSRCLWLMET